MTNNNLIVFGKTIKVKGLKGELAAYSLVDDVQPFLDLQKVFIGSVDNYQEWDLVRIKFSKQHFYFFLQGITSIEQAEPFKSLQLLCTTDQLAPLEPNQFYFKDIEGLLAYNTNDELVGRVMDLIDNGLQDILFLASDKYGEVLIPLTDTTIVEVAANKLILDFDPQLLFLNQP